MIKIKIETKKRKQALEISHLIGEKIQDCNDGVVLLFVPHTTASIVINEAYDPSVIEDILWKLEKLIPYSDNYKHIEGNSDAHIQSSIVGSSVLLAIENGSLALGRWQGVFFLEFDGPRNREIWVKILSR